MTILVRCPEGQNRKEVDLAKVQVPDLWHVAMHFKDIGEETWQEQILECWMLCHDLLTHAQQVDGSSSVGSWRDQAAADGVLSDYDYHLGYVEKPMPYRQWKMKFDALNRIQAMPAYQEGKPLPGVLEKQADQLCHELGY